MMCRKFFLFVLCVLLCCGSAQAQHVPYGSMIPGASLPASVKINHGSNGNAIIDDDLGTCWDKKFTTPTYDPDIILTPKNSTVASIWIRNGDHSSDTEYMNNRRVERLKVTVEYYVGDTLFSTDLIYKLSDVLFRYTFSAYTYDQQTDWINGYYCIVLPQTYYNVKSIAMNVESVYEGGTYRVCISDVLFSNEAPNYYEGDRRYSEWAELIQATGPIQLEQKTAEQANAYNSSINGIRTTLTMRLATRSGPGTQYTEPGSFLSAGDPCTVVYKAYDERNGIWWLQVDFADNNGVLYRAYTGAQRVALSDLNNVPTERSSDELSSMDYGEYAFGTGDCWYGPGENYAKYKTKLPVGSVGMIYMQENGFGLFEVYNTSPVQRVWVNMEDMMY